MSDETLRKIAHDGITRREREAAAGKLLRFGILASITAIIVALVWI